LATRHVGFLTFPKRLWNEVLGSALRRFVSARLRSTLSHMDREKLKRHLDEAEDQVARSIRHVAEQWNLIARLEGKGHDTATARRLLALLEESRDLHLVERDRLLRFIKEYSPDIPARDVGSPAPEDGTPS
jgi:hypothetical protein